MISSIFVQYEVNGKARYEPAPEMEARVRSMAMERLKMEKVYTVYMSIGTYIHMHTYTYVHHTCTPMHHTQLIILSPYVTSLDR